MLNPSMLLIPFSPLLYVCLLIMSMGRACVLKEGSYGRPEDKNRTERIEAEKRACQCRPL
jgi:hypothetical protein